MLATLIIVFREVIEAGLIIGIVMAATRGVAGRSRWIGGGVAAGVFGACIVALFASAIGTAMEGFGREMFNASVLILAVAMLTWHNVWMARHGRHIAMEMKHVGEDVAHGRRSLWALSIVVGVAVLREGAEVVLFLYGIALSGDESTAMMALGGALGLAMGGALGVLTYLGLLKIHNRHLFAVTGWMIALLAAGMASQAAAFLQQAGYAPGLTHIMWDSSAFISDSSLPGNLLHTLIGYISQPTALQLIAYVSTLAVIFILMRLFSRAPDYKNGVVASA